MRARHIPAAPAGARPPHRRRRLWAACVALLAAGAVGCGSAHDTAAGASTPAPRPTVTVSVTATVTETAEPEPAPTVTKTRTVHKPGPTVTVTRRAYGSSGSSGSVSTGSGSDSGSGSGTCSITSNAGNCYAAGQFCRNSDHGATTTTASGTRIRCSYSGSAWRWTYA
ncbi:hypothetical protein [Streptomyces sp. NPDC090057]|uniref:hypothetical protein n=1 Tax=Streptomyces sp. NPDC090057 TaxID=3365935 RepID=UPI0038025EBD